MAAFENFLLLWQCVQNMEGVRADMRANATAYKANSQGLTLAQMKALILADGQQYQNRLGWIAAIPQANRDGALTVATAIGLDANELTDAYQFLKSIADLQVQNAPTYSNFTQVNNGADYILNNVPAHYRLW